MNKMIDPRPHRVERVALDRGWIADDACDPCAGSGRRSRGATT